MGTSFASKTALAGRSRWTQYVRRLQGSSVEFDLTGYDPAVVQIAALEREITALSDDALRNEGRALRACARRGHPLLSLRARGFALVREAARRVLGQRPFDEQVVAALALDDGHIVEMQTGEGKTLAAVMPAALNALLDRGVHVLTFNDYLARRDAGWMGPVYEAVGLTVGSVQERMTPPERRSAYGADVTYVTAKEAGFDHLRDMLALDRSGLVHRPFHFALVDEADSLLLDEATVPLVIAGSADRVESIAPHLADVVRSMSPGLHFDSDEYKRNVALTEAGIEYVERLLGRGSLHDIGNIAILTEVNCALHAHVLLRRDVDYIVRAGRIEIVDERTGRVVTDRHWPDGLQAALEAKEGLARRADGRILGTITLQRFLRGYPRLCGMTGTAASAAAELSRLYGLGVRVIPTHQPAQRIDREDALFTHREAKVRAIVEEIRLAHRTGRPVLVGTSSVAESERLAARLRDTGIACDVLNAKNDAEEAVLVAGAGAIGAVTISTNMAGRGTDIRLGGAQGADHDRVAALGGLYVIGTSRHESRRVDQQLRGRAGRQGDPGESRFFVSLEDDLLVRFGVTALIPPRYRPERSDRPIDHPVVRGEVARAQRIIEGQEYDIRRTLERYAGVVESQHRLLAERRLAMLLGDDAPDVWQRAPEPRAALVAAAGEDAVADAERRITLACMDEAWRRHLAHCADVREGIHLVRLGGHEPLTVYTKAALEAFARIDDEIDDAVLAALEAVRVTGGALDLGATGLKGPSSTWTYQVNDDLFRLRLGGLLTSPGGATIAMYASTVLMPLMMLWAAIEQGLRIGARRRQRRASQHASEK